MDYEVHHSSGIGQITPLSKTAVIRSILEKA
jgi:hypothetical protein